MMLARLAFMMRPYKDTFGLLVTRSKMPTRSRRMRCSYVWGHFAPQWNVETAYKLWSIGLTVLPSRSGGAMAVGRGNMCRHGPEGNPWMGSLAGSVTRRILRRDRDAVYEIGSVAEAGRGQPWMLRVVQNRPASERRAELGHHRFVA